MSDSPRKILFLSIDKKSKDTLSFCFKGWDYEVFFEEELACIDTIKRTAPDVIVADVHNASKDRLKICRLLKDDFITAFIPVITLINKRQLRRQLLDIRQGVDDYLIKPPDPLDLRVRVEMALKRSQYSFYSSPLTGLPAGRIIEEFFNEKIKAGSKFSFAYVDIDNFKYFNDIYGYLKGDKVIMQTAYILYITVKKFGNPGDFIGHIGGDDFIFITTPDRYADICRNLIFSFDRITPFHYTGRDRKSGFIVARDRSRKLKKIPLMSLSVAVVNQTDYPIFKNVIEINDRVAEIKRYLKVMPGSKFMADRRDLKAGSGFGPQKYAKKEIEKLTYAPLGQILLGRKIITAEQLDEALTIHWRRDVALGEILKELKMIRDEDLKEALESQTKPR